MILAREVDVTVPQQPCTIWIASAKRLNL
jgi:hypothetical protein